MAEVCVHSYEELWNEFLIRLLVGKYGAREAAYYSCLLLPICPPLRCRASHLQYVMYVGRRDTVV